MYEDFEKNRLQMVTNMHQSLLNALRQREADIIKFLAILGPALAGFVYLLINFKPWRPIPFIVGTIGIQFILAVGGVYAVVLGYNFRSILYQMKRIEHSTGLNEFMLNKWSVYPCKPKSKNSGNNKTSKVDRLGAKGCPPEIIRVFWISFIVLILAITIAADYILCDKTDDSSTRAIVAISISGLVWLMCPILATWCYKRKLMKLYLSEVRHPGPPPPS